MMYFLREMTVALNGVSCKLYVRPETLRVSNTLAQTKCGFWDIWDIWKAGLGLAHLAEIKTWEIFTG